MKKVMLLVTLVATIAALAYPTPPCSGGVFGGRRSTECCKTESPTCDPANTAWITQASCDWWCCPSTNDYAINNCGVFSETGNCCSSSRAGSAKPCDMASPNPLECNAGGS